MSKVFQIIQAIEGNAPVLQVSGTLDENSDLTPLTQANLPELRLDLSGVRRVNSFGVRAWMTAIREIPSSVPLYYMHCSPPIIDQCNMIMGFRGHAQIVDFYAPLICDDCDVQKSLLFQTSLCVSLGGRLPPFECPECGEPMEIDDLEEHYLHFMQDLLT